jgi:hypothetical protein
MKKVLFFAMVIALLASGLAVAKLVDTPITAADLKDIMGTWTGERSGPRADKTDLKILNDSLPLKGELILYYHNKPPHTWPCTGHIEDGRLKLFWSNKAGSADLGLRKADDGSMELAGNIIGKSGGTVLLWKVKE